MAFSSISDDLPDKLQPLEVYELETLSCQLRLFFEGGTMQPMQIANEVQQSTPYPLFKFLDSVCHNLEKQRLVL